MKKLLHLAARVRWPASPLNTREACSDLWTSLSKNFDAIASAILPDHVHLATEDEPGRAFKTFAAVLGAFRSRWKTLRFDWETHSTPAILANDKHLARTIRYIHLNPCRDALCADPLQWEWSTHRDWIGAVAEPWVNLNHWAKRLKWGPRYRAEKFHAYVSGDPSVHVSGTSFPKALPLVGTGIRDLASLQQIATAVGMATRGSSLDPIRFSYDQRRLAAQAASQWTRFRPAQIAEWLGVHRATAGRLIDTSRRAQTPDLRAVALLLGDPRLSGGNAALLGAQQTVAKTTIGAPH